MLKSDGHLRCLCVGCWLNVNRMYKVFNYTSNEVFKISEITHSQVVNVNVSFICRSSGFITVSPLKNQVVYNSSLKVTLRSNVHFGCTEYLYIWVLWYDLQILFLFFSIQVSSLCHNFTNFNGIECLPNWLLSPPRSTLCDEPLVRGYLVSMYK